MLHTPVSGAGSVLALACERQAPLPAQSLALTCSDSLLGLLMVLVRSGRTVAKP